MLASAMPSKARVFMDAGAPITLRRDDGTQFEIERYAVWGERRRGKAEVFEVSNDLAALRAKYGALPLVDFSGKPVEG